MRAYVVHGPGRHELCEVDEPKPEDDEVLIAPAIVGICGSDRELIEGRRPAAYVRYPAVPGHEWAGYVVSFGRDVTGFAPGTGVVAEGIRACGRCGRCAEGRNNLCGVYAETGFTHPGALADLLVVPARLVHPLPDNRPISSAAMLEPAACVAGGLLEVGIPRAGSRIAVVGDGPVGLLAVSLLRLASPSELLLLGGQSHRIAFGPQLGASVVRLSHELSSSDLRDLRASFDLVVECTDSPSGATLALALARRAGTVLMVGISGSGTVSIDADMISLGSLRIQGVFGATRQAWQWLLSLFEAGLFDPAPLITHRFGLEHVADAFEVLADPTAAAVKVVVEPTGAPV
jgi:threonine dehydrogenase-like Zn-dependent dehydrogenase